MRVPEVSSFDDSPTRTRVAQSILEHGPSTAAALADRLDLTPAAIRRHLDQLLADGTLTARDQRVVGQRGRGRPAKVFVITDTGRDRFAHAYDDLAAQAIRHLHRVGGDDAVMAFARERLADVQAALEPLVDAAAPEDKARVIADQLTTEGFAASVGSTPAGEQICQHHCPVAHVASEFPQLCDAEAEMFAHLLGTHVQRLATIAHGDGVCTTHLPHPTPQTPTAERSPS